MSPLLINFIYNNFFENKILNNPNNFKILNFLISILFCISFLIFGKIIKGIFYFDTVSFGVVIFLVSFFIFDKITLILNSNLLFDHLFALVILFWALVFLVNYKKIQIKEILALIASYIISFQSLNMLNKSINLSTIDFLTSDEKYFWYPLSKNIYEVNYYDAIFNNYLSSYGLLIAHIHAVLNKIFSFSSEFLYFPAYKNIFFLLTIFFIFELKNSLNSKIIFSLFFSIIVLTSDWFNYLFFNSLLAESITSYFFGISIYESINDGGKKPSNKIVILCLGFLYFSKQFISIFSIFFGLYILLKNKERLSYYVLLFFGIIIDLLNAIFIDTPITWSMYLNNINTSEAQTFNGIKFENIINIIKQFTIDRPVSYFIFIIFLLSIYSYIQNSFEVKNVYLIIIVLNTIFVFLLYIFIWTNVEYESSYRYLLNVLHIIIIYTLNTFDIFLNKEK